MAEDDDDDDEAMVAIGCLAFSVGSASKGERDCLKPFRIVNLRKIRVNWLCEHSSLRIQAFSGYSLYV